MNEITHKKGYESSKIRKYNKEKAIDKINFLEDEFLDYGVVIETTYNEADVLYQDKVIKVKLDKSFNSVCNKTVYPGDKVRVKSGTITGILKRKNILCRDKFDGSKINGVGMKRIVAVNIDLAVTVVSAGYPPLHPKFIDRYAILLKANNIPFIIVMNKSDLKTVKEENILNIYKEIGIEVIETSTTNNIGIDKLQMILNDKQAIFVGHSGVGKSSLVNAIMDFNDVVVGSLGEKSKRGRHTTTTSKYYKWNDVSSIIDTPGIRSLDISNFDVYDIQNYFEEIFSLRSKCKYKDCLHYDEDVNDCYVKQKIDNLITKERYESYVKIIEELVNKGK